MALTKSSSDWKSFRFKPAPLSLKLPPAVYQRLRSTFLRIGSLGPKPKTKDSLCLLGGATDMQSVFVRREIGVLPQRMPANSEGMCPEPRVQHKPAGHCVYVVHTHNDAGISTRQSRYPIFEFYHLVGAPTGQRSLAHTKIAKVTNDGCSLADGSRKRSLDIC